MLRFLRAFFFLNTGSPGSRFRDGDNPTEASFRQLFDSVAFIKESADTAQLNSQGLAKCTADINAENRDSTEGVDNMTRFVKAHQLPNVNEGYGIVVTPIISNGGRVGGEGKDFLISNAMRVRNGDTPPLYPGNPIEITTDETGGLVIWDINMNPTALNLLETGKVKVTTGDNKDYLIDKVDSDAERIAISLSGVAPNQKVKFKVLDKLREVTMYHGTSGQFAADFPTANYNDGTNSANMRWAGWAWCDGNTYNGIQTPDMRNYFPVGVGSNYAASGDHIDVGSGASGADTITLTDTQSGLPQHTHAATAAPHHHSISDIRWSTTNGFDDAAGSGDGTTGAFTPDTDDTTVTVTNADAGPASAADAHENRPPFTALYFLMYCGY